MYCEHTATNWFVNLALERVLVMPHNAVASDSRHMQQCARNVHAMYMQCAYNAAASDGSETKLKVAATPGCRLRRLPL